MSLTRKSTWSVFARQCVDSQRLLQVHLSCLMLHQHALYFCFTIDSGGQKSSRERQTVFFTAVNPVEVHLHEQKEFDLTKPRLAANKQKWKVHQDAVYWVDIRLVQRKGLKFFQTRSNAIVLYDTLPSICIERVVSTETQEVLYTETNRSPRPVPTFTLKENWRKDWQNDAAANSSSSTTKPIRLKRNDQPAGTGETVTVRDRAKSSIEKTHQNMSEKTTTCVIQQARSNPLHVTPAP